MSLKTQSGRSMVEMLGTLAIIGVLSIGGIAGYTYAMNKYRANETINDINMRGIDLVRQVAMGRQTLSLSEWPTTSKAGYTFSDPILVDGDAYFNISGIPQSVCEMVYEGIQNNQTTKVEVNGTSAEDASACNKEEDNTIGFFFITNAGEGGTTPEDLCKNKTCPEGYSCTHGICVRNEAPPIGTSGMYCVGDNNVCKECQECEVNDYYQSNCINKTDGIACGNGSQYCKNGQCIANESTCTSNANCDKNLYCGYTSFYSGNKICQKAEYVTLQTKEGKKIYISKGNIGRDEALEVANDFCSSFGKKVIESETSDPDVIEYLYPNLDTGYADFVSQAGILKIYRTGEAVISNDTPGYVYILCLD